MKSTERQERPNGAVEMTVAFDDRQNPGLRKYSLAHEVAHIGLGHYRFDDFWTDAHGAASSEEDREADLFASIVLNPYASPIELLGPEQRQLL